MAGGREETGGGRVFLRGRRSEMPSGGESPRFQAKRLRTKAAKAVTTAQRKPPQAMSTAARAVTARTIYAPPKSAYPLGFLQPSPYPRRAARALA